MLCLVARCRPSVAEPIGGYRQDYQSLNSGNSHLRKRSALLRIEQRARLIGSVDLVSAYRYAD